MSGFNFVKCFRFQLRIVESLSFVVIDNESGFYKS